MNARGEIVPGVHRPPRREDYAPIIKALRPFVKGEELDLRCSLLLMRDRALANKPYACSPAWALLDVVQTEAYEAAFNWRISLDDLREFRRLCVMCVTNASSFDTLYRTKGKECA